MFSPELLDAESIVRFSEHVVAHAAADGNCVIVGRGSQHFLRTRNDTLRFFLYGPKEEELKRLIAEGKMEADARALASGYSRA